MVHKDEIIRRKIQLIAGSTYSVSLPKGWVLENKLKEKEEVFITRKGDKSLSIFPEISKKIDSRDTFKLIIEDYEEDISQILFVLYYLGFENIIITSNKELTIDQRSKTKEALRHMVGTEIFYEDKNKIILKVLLDKSKVDINQLFYRTFLLISSSIDLIYYSKKNLNEIKRNEDEIDRLYNLITKIIVLSQTNTSVLISSKIKHMSFIPSYLLLGKKLENIADKVYMLASHMSKSKKITKLDTFFLFIKKKIEKNMSFFLNKERKAFIKTERAVFEKLLNDIEHISDFKIIKYLGDLIRLIIDVEEELTNISFRNRLIRDKVL